MDTENNDRLVALANALEAFANDLERGMQVYIPVNTLKAASDFIRERSAKNTKIPPSNNIGATHWAVLPDGSVLFYRIVDSAVELYFPFSGIWGEPSIVPYTLHSFDDYNEA